MNRLTEYDEFEKSARYHSPILRNSKPMKNTENNAMKLRKSLAKSTKKYATQQTQYQHENSSARIDTEKKSFTTHGQAYISLTLFTCQYTQFTSQYCPGIRNDNVYNTILNTCYTNVYVQKKCRLRQLCRVPARYAIILAKKKN